MTRLVVGCIAEWHSAERRYSEDLANRCGVKSALAPPPKKTYSQEGGRTADVPPPLLKCSYVKMKNNLILKPDFETANSKPESAAERSLTCRRAARRASNHQ